MFLFGQLSNSGCHQNMSVPLLDISFLSQCLDLPAAHSETQSLTPWFCFLLSSLFVPFLFLTFIVIPNSLHLSSCTLLVLSHQALSCLVSCPCPVASSPLINLLSSLITLLATQSNLSHCLSCLLPSLATKVRAVSAGEVCAWVYGARGPQWDRMVSCAWQRHQGLPTLIPRLPKFGWDLNRPTGHPNAGPPPL